MFRFLAADAAIAGGRLNPDRLVSGFHRVESPGHHTGLLSATSPLLFQKVWFKSLRFLHFHKIEVERAKGLRIDSRAPARLAFQAGVASLPRFSQKLGSLLGLNGTLLPQSGAALRVCFQHLLRTSSKRFGSNP